ncbi:GNAT family N-acetyltransferase [Streptococcus gordonii]|uniref:GNAT family N-acetyltransferase n=1 Tax=Streptococcus gordonii TaxID=1302 RepID=UPI001CBCE261|nr:GNAT family N-acetyltransferase [Streptococcus gordonii]MBZ2134350.1 GNAT family N-acetyltransferase [Streptococcus gordonii]MBZ2142616.1 GNAT family N-acetyltransferase [Streptococcus gordonii]MBZ2144949.1 GNAT family N-acetyltransferase [Streptococcus gordonii]MBZ2146520.1 GNAT family N-acetyltransferase [Streptococcus gordonii]
MPMVNLAQPDVILINSNLRLRAYDGHYQVAFSWYQDPELVYFVDGKKGSYSLEKIKRMYEVLNQRGELYFIEVKQDDSWLPIGDVTFSENDLPIVIGVETYRSIGIGREVIAALIERARSLSYSQLRVQDIYGFNLSSKKLFTSFGFYPYEETDLGYRYVLDLVLPFSEIQPSQFFLSEKKLEEIATWFDQEELKPLPVKRLEDNWFLTDGHSRAFTAYLRGRSEIPVYFDRDDINLKFYSNCIRLCKEKNIKSIADLKDSILSEEAYQTEWIDWCKKSFESMNDMDS